MIELKSHVDKKNFLTHLKDIDTNIGLDTKTFDKLHDSEVDISKETWEGKEKLLEAYRNIVEILKEYIDMREEYYSLIALWIIGTYIHDKFMSFPYLYFNAMRGSGKTRILKLIACLSRKGEILNSLTEAVLFRTKGTLCIDEFEGLERKGKESLRELLNSAYKMGTKVKRLKKQKSPKGEEQVIEEFDVYRPIVIANITGMENVLSDRCISLVVEKSSNKKITKLMEIFENEKKTTQTKDLLNSIFLRLEKDNEGNFGVVCVDVVSVGNIYKQWNYAIKNNTNNTNTTNNTNNTNDTLISKLLDLDIEGRHLELAMPLFIIAQKMGNEILDQTIETIQNIIKEKKEEDITENRDVSLLDFLSQEIEHSNFISMKDLLRRFKEFLQTDEDEINLKWMGRALKRLELVIEKRRQRAGREVKINFAKAKIKMRIFK